MFAGSLGFTRSGRKSENRFQKIRLINEMWPNVCNSYQKGIGKQNKINSLKTCHFLVSIIRLLVKVLKIVNIHNSRTGSFASRVDLVIYSLASNDSFENRWYWTRYIISNHIRHSLLFGLIGPCAFFLKKANSLHKLMARTEE